MSGVGWGDLEARSPFVLRVAHGPRRCKFCLVTVALVATRCRAHDGQYARSLVNRYRPSTRMSGQQYSIWWPSYIAGQGTQHPIHTTLN